LLFRPRFRRFGQRLYMCQHAPMDAVNAAVGPQVPVGGSRNQAARFQRLTEAHADDPAIDGVGHIGEAIGDGDIS
jgi:hypothetical protein